MADDRSLLDRLNALKPTTVSLDKDELNSSPAFALQTEPTSKEDALSARLRTLRNASASPRREQQQRGTSSPGPPAQPPLDRHTSAPSTPSRSRLPSQPSGECRDDGNADIDPLFDADGSALDELLESLDLDDDIPLDQPPPLSFDPRDESKKVAALLEELQKPSSAPVGTDDTIGEAHDDDSEGEEMSAEVNQVLSRALDEAELDRSLSPDQQPDIAHSASPKQEAAGPQPSRPHPPDEPKRPSKADDKATPFSLPTVPSQLVDPAPTSTDHEDVDFETSIATRMAALKNTGSSFTATDPFGLPSTPNFNPDERPVAKPSFAGKLKGGYTDEDQKTWCVVCLEDATIKCLGCDEDVYCARCWRDMHVGPRAGYDERGHQKVKFERPR